MYEHNEHDKIVHNSNALSSILHTTEKKRRGERYPRFVESIKLPLGKIIAPIHRIISNLSLDPFLLLINVCAHGPPSCNQSFCHNCPLYTASYVNVNQMFCLLTSLSIVPCSNPGSAPGTLSADDATEKLVPRDFSRVRFYRASPIRCNIQKA